MEQNFTTEVSQFPNYKDILLEIKNQLSKRTGLIAKRALLIFWPALIYTALFTWFKDGQDISDSHLQIIFLITPFVLLYVLILNHLFSIEKNIWVDSFFDNKNLEPQASLRIAKKLFWPGFKLRLQIFIRYYLIPSTLVLIPFIYFFYLVSQLLPKDIFSPNNFNMGSADWMFLLGSFVLIPLILWIYFYYLNIKLRYIWFIFLDNFGKSDFSFQKLKSEMDKLNSISKSELFKKSLIMNIGVDTTKGLINFSMWSALRSLNGIGKGGEVAGSVIGAYGSELTNQLASYSKIIGNYILYRFACSVLYQRVQEVNENLYRL